MNRLAWLLTAFGLLLAQVQPVPAAMRLPAATQDCCPTADSCADHDTPQKPRDCSACLPCGPGCYLAMLTAPVVPGAVLAPQTRLLLRDELGATRRDPPPLPPPRAAFGRVIA